MTRLTGSSKVLSNDGPLRWTFLLAVGATATAVCISVLAGWQRGGGLPERLVWVAVSVVLVVCAHMLPALCRSAPILTRGAGSLLWITCIATACYGHATFFLLAQQHAGERRVSSVVSVTASNVPVGRTLTAVMNERANVSRQLATADVLRCLRDCRTLNLQRAVLAARLDKLMAEADDVRRVQAADDKEEERRDALMADPVTSRLSALLGTSSTRIDLALGLAFALVLECVSCLLWSIALQSRTGLVETPQVTTTVVPGREPVRPSHDLVGAPLVVTDSEVTKLANDVAAGRVRATVSGIRRHLKCSQAKAASLRRQLVEQALIS